MKRRIDSKSSMTAAMICSLRAASYVEKNKNYKSNDFVALIMIPKVLRFLIKFKIIKTLLTRAMTPKGIYEYVIARTKYIDEKLTEVIEGGVEQVFIFSAGFDSRAIRFKQFKNIAFFELDEKHTQTAKIGQFERRNIKIPENLEFITIDFDKEDFETAIKSSGFQKSKKTLFILEGLVMYLDKKSVIDLLEKIKSFPAKGSLIIFDFIYASVLREEGKYYGENNIYKRVNKYGENWKFGLEDDNPESFFNQLDLKVIELLNSKVLEDKYFRKGNSIIGKVNGTHCISLSEVK